MKLLFDQNLAPKLASRLAGLFPGSSHVQWEGIDQASDEHVWEHARRHGLCIVSKDGDYSAISALRGVPPKVIWLQVGNCTTDRVEEVLRDRLDEIQSFELDTNVGVLILN